MFTQALCSHCYTFSYEFINSTLTNLCRIHQTCKKARFTMIQAAQQTKATTPETETKARVPRALFTCISVPLSIYHIGNPSVITQYRHELQKLNHFLSTRSQRFPYSYKLFLHFQNGENYFLLISKLFFGDSRKEQIGLSAKQFIIIVIHTK